MPKTPAKATATASSSRPSKLSSDEVETQICNRAPDCTPSMTGVEEQECPIPTSHTCASPALEEDAVEEPVMKLSSNENDVCPSRHGCETQNDARADKSTTSYPKIDYPTGGYLVPISDARHSEAQSTLWLAWYTQTGMPNGYTIAPPNVAQQVVWVDPACTMPFPRWMADGLGKYFLLAISTMLHLNQVRYSDTVEICAPVHSHLRRLSMVDALHQSMWMAIVWWQSQTFDAQLNFQLRHAVESTARDEQACCAMGLGSERDTVPLAQMMLHCVPMNLDENVVRAANDQHQEPKITQYDSPPREDVHSFIQYLMDMRGWSLVEVARNTLCMNPLRGASFWSTVPLCNTVVFKKKSAQLMVLPALCTAMRRINMLRSVFYGYPRALELVDKWDAAITQYMLVMDRQYDTVVPGTTSTHGNFMAIDKDAAIFVNAQLRRIMEAASKDHMPLDARTLFMHAPIGLLEQCALVCHQCSARSYYNALIMVKETDIPMLLGCLMRAVAVHWAEGQRDLTVQQRQKYQRLPNAREIYRSVRDGWLQVDTLLPPLRNPLINGTTLCDSDLIPPYCSVERWKVSLGERRAASPVVVVGDRLFTMPMDVKHLLANVTYHSHPPATSTEPVHQSKGLSKHVSMLISSPNRPDMLLHYTSPDMDRSKERRARWTLVACSEFNSPPTVLEVSVPHACSSTNMPPISKEETFARKSQRVRSTPYHPHLLEARSVVSHLFEKLPHAYLFRVLDVHGAKLDVTAYERAAHANLMQHVARTMPHGSAGGFAASENDSVQ